MKGCLSLLHSQKTGLESLNNFSKVSMARNIYILPVTHVMMAQVSTSITEGNQFSSNDPPAIPEALRLLPVSGHAAALSRVWT